MRTTDEPRRILVVANETVADPDLKAKIVERCEGASATVFVTCPALNSRIKHWCSDEDHARAAAAARLDASLLALWSEGIDARGEVGDANPVIALRDAFAKHRPDEVIVSTHPPGRSNWLEKGVVEKARTLAGPIPVIHVVASARQSPARLHERARLRAGR